jgi:hypothetical protein
MRRSACLLTSAAWLAAVVASSCVRDDPHDSDGPPEWILVGQNDSVAIYRSALPPQETGDHLRAKFEVFYLKPHRLPSNERSTVSIWNVEYDCANHQYAMLSTFALERRERDTLDRVIYANPAWRSDSSGVGARGVAGAICGLVEAR